MAAYGDGEILLTSYDERVDLYEGGQADADAAVAESAANALRAAVELKNGDFPLAKHALETHAARTDGLAAPDRASPDFVQNRLVSGTACGIGPRAFPVLDIAFAPVWNVLALAFGWFADWCASGYATHLKSSK